MQIISSSKRTIILIICGAILGFIMLQWVGVTTQQSRDVVSEQIDHTPNYFMTNFSVATTREDGGIHQWLQGRQLNHYNDGITKIEAPSLKMNTQKHAVWQVNSNYGEVDKENIITLDGNVVVAQSADIHEQIQINTNRLVVDMKAHIAESHSQVTVTNNNATVVANKMVADLEAQHIQLYAGVKAEYVDR